MKRTTSTIATLSLIAITGASLYAKPNHHRFERSFTNVINGIKRFAKDIKQQVKEIRHEGHDDFRGVYDNFKTWLNKKPCVQTFNAHQALNKRHYDRLQELLAHGGNANARNFFGQTLLHRAVLNHDAKAVEILLSYDADVSLENSNGRTALNVALNPERPIDLDIISLLLEHGADPNKGMSILRIAELDSKYQLPCAQLLIGHGADIVAVDQRGENLLHCLVDQECNVDLVAYLFVRQIDGEKRNTNGQTPLNKAAQANNTELAIYLIERGCNVNAPDNDGVTALHHAATNNNLSLAKHLLHYGAHPTPDTHGQRPLDIACNHARIEVAEFLIEHNQTSSACTQLATQKKLAETTAKIASYKEQCTLLNLDHEACTMAALLLALEEAK